MAISDERGKLRTYVSSYRCILTTYSQPTVFLQTVKKMESTLPAFMAEARITLQNLDDRMRKFENPDLLLAHSTPFSVNIVF